MYYHSALLYQNRLQIILYTWCAQIHRVVAIEWTTGLVLQISFFIFQGTGLFIAVFVKEKSLLGTVHSLHSPPNHPACIYSMPCFKVECVYLTI